MAPDSSTFAGWLTSWESLKSVGINPFEDFKSIQFSGSHDSVIKAVKLGKVDAGSVRTSALELADKAGLIKLSDFRIINQDSIYKKSMKYHLLLSTSLYPGWPIAKLSHVSDEIAKKVAVVLLSIPPDDACLIAGNYSGWILPKSYMVVTKSLMDLKYGPFLNYGKISTVEAVKQHWFVSSCIFTLLMISIVLSFILYNKNNKIKKNKNVIEMALNENKKLVEELKKHENMLLELNRTKDKFFSIIAHDLRNPLGSFKSATDLLLNAYDTLTEQERKQLITLVKESSENVYALLENLLTWAKAQRGNISTNPEMYNLNRLVSENISLLSGQTNNKNITLTNLMIDETIGYCDVNLFNTIIRNLISNSIKFTPTGGRIIIDSKIHEDNFIAISVNYNGLGMTNDIVEKLFRIDFSHSTPGTNDEKGTGLGLLLCKEFVEKMNGTIWAESEAGKGSTFIFTIPKIKF